MLVLAFARMHVEIKATNGLVTISQLEGLGSTAAFRTFIAVNEDATDICLAAQGMFDDTKRREILEDVPWMADELTTVIEVVFDCVPGES